MRPVAIGPNDPIQIGGAVVDHGISVIETYPVEVLVLTKDTTCPGVTALRPRRGSHFIHVIGRDCSRARPRLRIIAPGVAAGSNPAISVAN